MSNTVDTLIRRYTFQNNINIETWFHFDYIRKDEWFTCNNDMFPNTRTKGNTLLECEQNMNDLLADNLATAPSTWEQLTEALIEATEIDWDANETYLNVSAVKVLVGGFVRCHPQLIKSATQETTNQ